eukprot:GHVQ01026279.1.p1 GENE.GHVQ01026279.1~~GHVQ01026279.1.p1  ORF type:complete len:2237 (-),score=461.93 GHVQ01026279.1:356-7066(-)
MMTSTSPRSSFSSSNSYHLPSSASSSDSTNPQLNINQHKKFQSHQKSVNQNNNISSSYFPSPSRDCIYFTYALHAHTISISSWSSVFPYLFACSTCSSSHASSCVYVVSSHAQLLLQLTDVRSYHSINPHTHVTASNHAFAHDGSNDTAAGFSSSSPSIENVSTCTCLRWHPTLCHFLLIGWADGVLSWCGIQQHSVAGKMDSHTSSQTASSVTSNQGGIIQHQQQQHQQQHHRQQQYPHQPDELSNDTSHSSWSLLSEYTEPHSAAIICIEFNPEGTRCVTGDAAGTVAVWKCSLPPSSHQHHVGGGALWGGAAGPVVLSPICHYNNRSVHSVSSHAGGGGVMGGGGGVGNVSQIDAEYPNTAILFVVFRTNSSCDENSKSKSYTNNNYNNKTNNNSNINNHNNNNNSSRGVATNSFFFGSAGGTISYADDCGICSERYTIDSGVDNNNSPLLLHNTPQDNRCHPLNNTTQTLDHATKECVNARDVGAGGGGDVSIECGGGHTDRLMVGGIMHGGGKQHYRLQVLMYYEPLDRVVLISSGMILVQFSLDHQGNITAHTQTQLAAGITTSSLKGAWCGEGVLGTVCNEGSVRFWSIRDDTNSILHLSTATHSSQSFSAGACLSLGEKATSIAYHNEKRLLAVGTSKGRVFQWISGSEDTSWHSLTLIFDAACPPPDTSLQTQHPPPRTPHDYSNISQTSHHNPTSLSPTSSSPPPTPLAAIHSLCWAPSAIVRPALSVMFSMSSSRPFSDEYERVHSHGGVVEGGEGMCSAALLVSTPMLRVASSPPLLAVQTSPVHCVLKSTEDENVCETVTSFFAAVGISLDVPFLAIWDSMQVQMYDCEGFTQGGGGQQLSPSSSSVMTGGGTRNIKRLSYFRHTHIEELVLQTTAKDRKVFILSGNTISLLTLQGVFRKSIDLLPSLSSTSTPHTTPGIHSTPPTSKTALGGMVQPLGMVGDRRDSRGGGSPEVCSRKRMEGNRRGILCLGSEVMRTTEMSGNGRGLVMSRGCDRGLSGDRDGCYSMDVYVCVWDVSGADVRAVCWQRQMDHYRTRWTSSSNSSSNSNNSSGINGSNSSSSSNNSSNSNTISSSLRSSGCGSLEGLDKELVSVSCNSDGTRVTILLFIHATQTHNSASQMTGGSAFVKNKSVHSTRSSEGNKTNSLVQNSETGGGGEEGRKKQAVSSKLADYFYYGSSSKGHGDQDGQKQTDSDDGGGGDKDVRKGSDDPGGDEILQGLQLFVYDVENDVFFRCSPGDGRSVVSHMWDCVDPRLLVCETVAAVSPHNEQSLTDSATNGDTDSREILVLFVTPDGRVKQHERISCGRLSSASSSRADQSPLPQLSAYNFAQDTERGYMDKCNVVLPVGISVPNVFVLQPFSTRTAFYVQSATDGRNRLGNMSMSSLHSFVLVHSTLKDFLGLDGVTDGKLAAALVDFSYHLCLGEVDAAYRVVQNLVAENLGGNSSGHSSKSIWRSMAQMCVKTKRLDVASQCIAHMENATAAQALRKCEHADANTKLAILATHLGMIDQAMELYKASGRYDRMALLCEDINCWDESMQVTKSFNRLAISTAHYNCGKHLQAMGEYESACSELSESLAITERSGRSNTIEQLVDGQNHQQQTRGHEDLEKTNSIEAMLYGAGQYESLIHYVQKAARPSSYVWQGRLMESMGDMKTAGECYDKSEAAAVTKANEGNVGEVGEGDTSHRPDGRCTLELTQLACAVQDWAAAKKICDEGPTHPAACYYLARILEGRGDGEAAIKYYGKAGRIQHAMRVADSLGLDEDLMSLALSCAPKHMVAAAAYYRQRGDYEKSATLYTKGGRLEVALRMCVDADQTGLVVSMLKEPGSVQRLVDNATTMEGLGERSGVEFLETMITALLQQEEYEIALELMAATQQYENCLELCESTNIPLTEELVEKITPPKDQADEVLLFRLAQICRSGGLFVLACKYYTMAGQKVEAMKCLIEAGMTSKIVFFASTARVPEVSVIAANYLQTLINYKQIRDDSNLDTASSCSTTNEQSLSSIELCKHVVQLYTQAKAYRQLATFLRTSAQMYVEILGNYEKASNQIQQCLRVMDLGNKQSKKTGTAVFSASETQVTAAQLEIIQRFIQLRAMEDDGTGNKVEDCWKLVATATQTENKGTVRVGDIFALLIRYYHERKNHKEAFKIIRIMREDYDTPLADYVDRSLLEEVCSNLSQEDVAESTDKDHPADYRGNHQHPQMDTADSEISEEEDMLDDNNHGL